MIEGQQITQQAIQWIQNQQEQMHNRRKHGFEYKRLLQNAIGEKKKQKQEINKKQAELEKMEMEENMKQMQEVLSKEHKNESQRRINRQKADNISKFNCQQKRESKSSSKKKKKSIFLSFVVFISRFLSNEFINHINLNIR